MLYVRNTLEEKIFEIMDNIKTFKATGIDKLPGRFLKDDTEILAKPIGEIRKLSISQEIFPNDCKVTKLKGIFKKDKEVDLITRLSRYCQSFQKPFKT